MNCPWHQCEKPIEEHKAGHQMDACVAAAAMGLPVINSKETFGWYIDGEATMVKDGVEIRRFARAEFPVKYMPILPYSRTYDSVRQVLDALRRVYYIDIGIDEHGAQVQINRYEPPVKEKEGKSIVSGGCWSLAVESTRADTMPEAVCKAALILVKTESEAMDALSQM